MEFTKRSNLGSVLAAVAVGLLALVVNKITPERIDRFVHGMESMAAAKSVPNGAPPAPFAGKSVAWLIERQKNCAEFLSQGYQQKSIDSAQLHRAVSELLAFDEALNQRELGTEDKKRAEAHLFRGLFAAAELLPSDYSSNFLERAKPLLTRQPENGQFHLLYHFHSLRLDQSSQAEILERLRQMVAQESNADRAIDVHLLAAKELDRRNRLGDALAVLDHGKNCYRDHPSRTKLSNFAIELKSRLLQRR